MSQKNILYNNLIFVVDDDLEKLKLLVLELESAGYDVISASNGSDCLKLAKEKFPDLILLDVNLPDINGFDICKEIKSNPELAHILVVFLSASQTTSENKIVGLDCGVDGYITQPISRDEFLAWVKAFIRIKKTEDKLLKLLLTDEELRTNEEMFRTLVSSMDDLIFTLNKEKKCTAIYGCLIQKYGILHEIFLDSKAEEILDSEVASLFESVYNLVFTGQSAIYDWWFYNKQDKKKYFFQTSLSPIWSSEGEIIGAVGAARDITEQKKTEEILKETNVRLQKTLTDLETAQHKIIQQERLRALGTMASGIAHDFNNVLSPIVGFSDLLLKCPEYLEDKKKISHYLQIINLAALDAAKVVSRLREFYRYRDEQDKLQPIYINKIVEQVISLTEPRWKAQAQSKNTTITIKTDYQKVPIIFGNESEVRELLTNLVFNAVDAINDNGTITISTLSDKHNILLKVSDTGCGMTEEVKKQCLEPFFSTKGEKGTGLGLSMVYGIVQRSNGEINIESTVGKGTTFIVNLPIVKENIEEKVKKNKLEKYEVKSLNILIVDDEPFVREMITEFLLNDNHTIETAVNGNDGFQKFLHGKFDLVITDKSMPELSGDQLAIQIKNVNPHLPVILLTGFGDLIKSKQKKIKGIDLIINKPTTLEILQKAIKQVMKRD